MYRWTTHLSDHGSIHLFRSPHPGHGIPVAIFSPEFHKEAELVRRLLHEQEEQKDEPIPARHD